MTEQQKVLVNEYYEFIHWIMHKDFSDIPLGSRDYEDVSQVGYLALCEAADKWKPDISTFTTYAYRFCWGKMKTYWNRNMSGYINHRLPDKSNYVHIPVASLDKTIANDENENDIYCLIDNNESIYDSVDILEAAKVSYLQANEKYGDKILGYLLKGCTQAEIAIKLGVSRTYISRVVKKAHEIYKQNAQ